MSPIPGTALIALLLAWNYFAFQVEIFDCEYEANHPARQVTVSFVAPALSWESFDKDQAPAPYLFDAGARLEVVSLLPFFTPHSPLPYAQPQPVRDKSPPPA
jgi:hypothetical protein